MKLDKTGEKTEVIHILVSLTREEKFETWYKRYNMVAAIDRDKYLDKLTFKRN